jgi:hypothetical protein
MNERWLTQRKFQERERDAMAAKSKNVKVQFKNPTTGEVRTFKLTLTTPATDSSQTNLLKERVVIIRRMLSSNELAKVRVKVI